MILVNHHHEQKIENDLEDLESHLIVDNFQESSYMPLIFT